MIIISTNYIYQSFKLKEINLKYLRVRWIKCRDNDNIYSSSSVNKFKKTRNRKKNRDNKEKKGKTKKTIFQFLRVKLNSVIASGTLERHHLKRKEKSYKRNDGEQKMAMITWEFVMSNWEFNEKSTQQFFYK